MYVEKDLKKIEKTAAIKEQENFRFRTHLKGIDMKSSEIDSIVRELYDRVIEQIDCAKCANCCNTQKPELDNRDIKKFVSSLQMKEQDFREMYLEETESYDNEKKYEFNSLPCPFLKDNLCSNYENRPKDCQSYPHLLKKDFISRLWGVIDNYEVCPIVFNVYEGLKLRLWRRR